MNELSRIIAEEIRNNGALSTARFMELALYCPVYGYYERDADIVGRQGDFQTSVSVGPVFGELLGARVASWLDCLRARGETEVQLVEAGAHNGQLALDIMSWLKCQRPDLLDHLHYHFLEPSTVREGWQRATLGEYCLKAQWSRGFVQLKERTGGVRGVMLSNEVLDALPVHRFAWDCQKHSWFEWMVDEENSRFVWRRGEAPKGAHQVALGQMISAELLAVLPDGYVIEYSPAAVQWWRQAAETVKRGWLLTFDYGFDCERGPLPVRANGTFRGYRHHQIMTDVLAHPGEQDLTAHVCFDLIRACGQEAGLFTEFFGEQGRFLVQTLEQNAHSAGVALQSDPGRMRQFKTLIHPNHFGTRFKVLVQSRLE